jgi:hypothetical protein
VTVTLSIYLKYAFISSNQITYYHKYPSYRFVLFVQNKAARDKELGIVCGRRKVSLSGRERGEMA